MTALCHIRGISTSSQETFDNPGSHLPFAHNGTKVSLLPRKQNFIHYVLLPWTSLWTEKHWTLFFQGCANKKSEVINECVLFAAVRQPFFPTEENLDLGANFVKVLKSNAAVKIFQPQPETPFVSSSPFFPWLPSTVNLLLSPCSKSCRINDFSPLFVNTELDFCGKTLIYNCF